jgi:hypothetical protein
MTPYIEEGIHIIIKHLYQKKKREHFTIENALLSKLNLNVSFIPKMFTCYMLHNMLKNEKEANIY